MNNQHHANGIYEITSNKINDQMKALNPNSEFGQLAESEAFKIQCAQLYYRIEAISSIADSLLKPSPIICWGPIVIFKLWGKRTSSFTIFASADLINSSFGIVELFQLTRNLKNEKNSLKRILDNTWPNWKKEIKRPLVINDLSFASEYSDPIIKKEILRAQLEPSIVRVHKVCREAIEVVGSIRNRELAAIVVPGLLDFSKLFKFLKEMTLLEQFAYNQSQND